MRRGQAPPDELWLLVQNIDAVHGLYYLPAHLALAGTTAS